MATGEVVEYTAILEGVVELSGRNSVDTKESWNYSAQQNKWTATVEYTHTHGFQSAPSNIDVFAGILPYIDSGPNAMGAAQKADYLSYHSINVLTANHRYIITITDPAKWVSRYPNRRADYDVYERKTQEYQFLGHPYFEAQELALLELYGDMTNLYRSSLDQFDFKPLKVMPNPNTMSQRKKIIFIIHCNN